MACTWGAGLGPSAGCCVASILGAVWGAKIGCCVACTEKYGWEAEAVCSAACLNWLAMIIKRKLNKMKN